MSVGAYVDGGMTEEACRGTESPELSGDPHRAVGLIENAVCQISLEPKLPHFRSLLEAFSCEPLAMSMTLKRPGKRELGELTWVC